VDCNDNNPAVHPGATEVCNSIDDNCDTQIDEGVKTTFYADADNDTYGNPAITASACTAPGGFVANNTDCNDSNASIKPGATETCNNIDDNCNTQIDEGVKIVFYADVRANGHYVIRDAQPGPHGAVAYVPYGVDHYRFASQWAGGATSYGRGEVFDLAPGGTNFDAKVRRESFEPLDLFHAERCLETCIKSKR